mmetsp:Transcript_72836/g.184113  ORF Transcript_72836/g.184113 Transcript_72836/m.184113 type:complete len:101 (-) Transcript_72836:1259-1561(-)
MPIMYQMQALQWLMKRMHMNSFTVVHRTARASDCILSSMILRRCPVLMPRMSLSERMFLVSRRSRPTFDWFACELLLYVMIENAQSESRIAQSGSAHVVA